MSFETISHSFFYKYKDTYSIYNENIKPNLDRKRSECVNAKYTKSYP